MSLIRIPKTNGDRVWCCFNLLRHIYQTTPGFAFATLQTWSEPLLMLHIYARMNELNLAPTESFCSRNHWSKLFQTLSVEMDNIHCEQFTSHHKSITFSRIWNNWKQNDILRFETLWQFYSCTFGGYSLLNDTKQMNYTFEYNPENWLQHVNLIRRKRSETIIAD